MKRFTANVLALFTCVSSLYAQQLPLKEGRYDAHLQLSQATLLPVRISVESNSSSNRRLLVIHNAAERIELKVAGKSGDTLILPFPMFDSELRVVASGKQYLNGYWINHNKSGNYRIPFSAGPVSTRPGDPATESISGRWESYFSPKTPDQEASVGVFEQKGSIVTGTVLTETGDYRFLEGTMEGNRFFLSCFDGSHAFLLKGAVTKNGITGTFFSGKHYQTPWTATKNDTFELRDADSLTFLKEESAAVQFTLKDINGADYSFPNPATTNKVVIIQIMGTWCPNCMDETKFYKELYAKYHDRGLEIISIGYEAADSFEDQAAKIQRLKDRHQLAFTFLVGGKANKGLASQHFAVLNEVISFPTTVFIGRDGQVKRIHTGFNGPGTGAYYTEYVEKTNALIEGLLGE